MNSDSRTFGKTHKNTKLHDRGVPVVIKPFLVVVAARPWDLDNWWYVDSDPGTVGNDHENRKLCGFGLPVLAGLTYDDFLCT
jgi:hypothetical protein